MKKSVTLQIEDYLYQFYQIGAAQLNQTPEALMEQALFIYAGIVANDINNSTNRFTDGIQRS